MSYEGKEVNKLKSSCNPKIHPVPGHECLLKDHLPEIPFQPVYCHNHRAELNEAQTSTPELRQTNRLIWNISESLNQATYSICVRF